MWVVNQGTTDVPLPTLVIRYFYTDETQRPQIVECYTAEPDCAGGAGVVYRMDPPVVGADAFLEYTFTTTRVLGPGEGTGEIALAVHADNWSSYSERDDHSWDDSNSQVDEPQVALYQDGVLVWGNEPACQ